MRLSISKLQKWEGEIQFVLMNSEELHYRLNMLDRFFVEFLEI